MPPPEINSSIGRIILNKADKLELRRVYGELIWSLAKVFDKPETPMACLGSFWDKSKGLFKIAEQKLFVDLLFLSENDTKRNILRERKKYPPQ